MSLVERYLAYALAFREASATDDWSRVEPFFCEEAVYDVPFDPPFGGHFTGRSAILAYFRDSVAGYDRRFESREGAFIDGPREEGSAVRARGRIVCRSTGVPDWVIELEEIAHFTGDRICRLEDRYDDAMKASMRAYVAAHGARLGLGGTYRENPGNLPRPARLREGVASIVLRPSAAGTAVLLLERATEPFSGAWFPVEGTLEAGEEPVAAALREIREETGLAPLRIHRLDESPRLVASGVEPVLIHVFVAFVAAEAAVVLNDEHTRYAWLGLGEAIAQVPLESQRRALREVDARFVRRQPPARCRIEEP